MESVASHSKPLFMSRSHVTTESNITGTWRYMRPRYQEKTSPCSAACPAGEDIARIEMLAGQSAFREAWETILLENPLPGVCGRVCFHPCEGECNRQNFDSPIAVHHLERFLSDTSVRNQFQPAFERLTTKPQKVAIVGSGPAGLSAAWFLSMLGYECDVFEAQSKAGGILRWGIPEYRLPSAVLQSEIGRIAEKGVRIFLGRPITSESFRELRGKYSAVFLGCGYGRGRTLGIAGETESTVADGLDFLRKIRNRENTSCKGLTAVIGGGNTAIDVARSVMRLGGKAVILYRRRRQDMPGFEEELLMALEEGVELRELLTPIKIEPDENQTRLTLQPMKIEGQDQDGRGRIAPDGDQTSMIVDRVFAATGADVAESWYNPPSQGRGWMAWSHCSAFLETGNVPVIYGGDLTNRTKNVTHAIASGKQAAMVLDTFFRQGFEAIESRLQESSVGNSLALSMEMYLGGRRSVRSKQVVPYSQINADYFQYESRVAQPRLLPKERTGSFDEIDLRISPYLAMREAGRCFNCGLCNECDNCYLFCPDLSVIPGKNIEERRIDYDYCKGCGICVAECPRNAMILGEE
jgi:NADPH-dependent glutamate synthase beta subunit-like oxidoreductase/Pyruvate/2-oxoacid:ferredoxin oxidoreductase delta subunit